MKKTTKHKLSAAEKKLILVFSEQTGITDKLPLRVIRIGRWFVVRWPLDEAYFDEAWIGGERWDDVPKSVADRLWATGDTTEIQALLPGASDSDLSERERRKPNGPAR